MSTQRSLFDSTPWEWPAYVGRDRLARRGDPQTSHAAAQLTAPRDRAVWAHLKCTGRTMTPDELASEMGRHAPTVSSALSRLTRDGFVVKVDECGVSACGRPCSRYRAAP